MSRNSEAVISTGVQSRFPEAWNPVGGATCTDSALHDVLRRERSRADRTLGQLALVTFRLTGKQVPKRITTDLVTRLERRCRCIDVIGTSDARTVWLVLPGCDANNARALALDVCATFSRNDVHVQPDISSYDAADESDSADAGLPGPGSAEGFGPIEPDTPDLCQTDRVPGNSVSAQSLSGYRLSGLLVQATPLWKRAMDVFVAGAALAVLSPLFAIVAVAVKLSSPGSVFFCQWRSGRGGVPFRMYKFRSMVAEAEAQKAGLMPQNERDGPAFKIRNDPRVTRVGAILRQLSLDELPQLWNVLIGQMSLVGPRPLPCPEMALCDSWQRERLHVTPGLTCIWQVTAQRSAVPFRDWMRMDVRYVRNRSVSLDCRLLVRTAGRVVCDALGLSRG